MNMSRGSLDEMMTALVKEVAAELRSEVVLAIRSELGAGDAPSQRRWLNTKEAAEYLGVHPDTLGKAASRGEIESEQEKPGAKRWFEPQVLDAWRRGEPQITDAA
jgi:excisionase family DNA binding protein